MTVPQALLIAAVFEVSGAVIAGGEVTDTIRNGIVKLDDIQGKKKLFSMKKMQMLTNSSYDNVQVFPSYCILEKDGLEAFFDADEEKILLPLAYESITTNMYKSTFIVSKGKKFVLLTVKIKPLFLLNMITFPPHQTTVSLLSKRKMSKVLSI